METKSHSFVSDYRHIHIRYMHMHMPIHYQIAAKAIALCQIIHNTHIPYEIEAANHNLVLDDHTPTNC